MSGSEMLDLYTRKARATGVRVEFVPMDDLPARLTALFGEYRDLAADPGIAGAPSGGAVDANPGDATHTAPPARIAALPSSGWPEEVLRVVESALAASGFEIVSPAQAREGTLRDSWRCAEASLGVIFCERYLAETGSMALPAGPGAGTLAALLPKVHIALSTPEGCLGSLGDYLSELNGTLPSRLTLITGPSRTGDIEATMTEGVHGPAKVIHFILTGRE